MPVGEIHLEPLPANQGPKSRATLRNHSLGISLMALEVIGGQAAFKY